MAKTTIKKESSPIMDLRRGYWNVVSGTAVFQDECGRSLSYNADSLRAGLDLARNNRKDYVSDEAWSTAVKFWEAGARLAAAHGLMESP